MELSLGLNLRPLGEPGISSPDDIPDLQWWFDPSDPTSYVIESGKVSQATAKKTPYVLSQPTADNQPIVDTFNGLNVWSGAGGGVYFPVTPSPIYFTGYATFCMMVQKGTNLDSYVTSPDPAFVYPMVLSQFDPGGGRADFEWIESTVRENFIVDSGGEYVVLAVSYDSDAVEPKLKGYLNGSYVFGMSGITTWATAAISALFARSLGVSEFDGKIAEGPMFYLNVLTPDQMMDLSNYCRRKRGLV